MITEFSFLRS